MNNESVSMNEKAVPVIDLSECQLCGICTELCPDVFHMNSLGFIDVMELSHYPVQDVCEAVKNCPASCIMYHIETSPFT